MHMSFFRRAIFVGWECVFLSSEFPQVLNPDAHEEQL
jgi:hypothetical protein